MEFDQTTIYVISDFFGGVRGSNPGPCIYYALSLSTKLSSQDTWYVIGNTRFGTTTLTIFFKIKQIHFCFQWVTCFDVFFISFYKSLFMSVVYKPR